MALDKLFAFALLQTLFAITPGPAVLLTIAHAMTRGIGAGLRVAMGVLLGNALYLCLSALGVGLLLRAWPAAFEVLKMAGASYLAWRGIAGIRDALRSRASSPLTASTQRMPRPFVEGLACQLANPKSIIFFGALLPMFVQPGPPLLPQYAVLAGLCMLIELPVLAAYAGMAAIAGRLAPSPRATRLRQLGSGACLVVVAVLLVLVPAVKG